MTLVRNLHDAIARVREDVEKVEFWAEAVSGFGQPVPDYTSADTNVWVPAEQATRLTRSHDRPDESNSRKASATGKAQGDRLRKA